MTKEQETEYERQQHEAWKNYSAKHHVIHNKEEFEQLLNDPSVIFEAGDGIPILKLVKDDYELREFLLRFVSRNSHTGVLSNYEAADEWFRGLICHKDQVDEYDIDEDDGPELIDTIVNAPAKLLDHNEFYQDHWNGFSWHERTYSGFSADDYKVLFQTEYPCLVRVQLLDDRDRMGDIRMNHTTFTPLSQIISGKTFFVEDLERIEEDD